MQMNTLSAIACTTGMVVVAILAVAQPAVSDESHHGMIMVHRNAIKWQPGPPSLAKGIEIAVLAGDPSKPGPFVMRSRTPANTVVAPHTHPTDENLTIIAGTVYHAMGEKFDRAAGVKMGRGDFVYLAADTAHSAWTGDEPAEVQITGTGPFTLKYVNPADDPTPKQ